MDYFKLKTVNDQKTQEGTLVTKQDPVGPSKDRPLSYYL